MKPLAAPASDKSGTGRGVCDESRVHVVATAGQALLPRQIAYLRRRRSAAALPLGAWLRSGFGLPASWPGQLPAVFGAGYHGSDGTVLGHVLRRNDYVRPAVRLPQRNTGSTGQPFPD